MNANEVYFESEYHNKKFLSYQFEEMKQRGWVEVLNDGRILFDDNFYDIMQRIDNMVISWLNEEHVKQIYYPDLYRISDLEQCNYVSQFHPHCLFPHLSKAQGYTETENRSSGFIINPAVCMHSYIQYQNAIINENEPVIILSKGKCKRYEEKGYTTIERLLDFTMREIIFIGSDAFVLKKRKELMEKARQFMIEKQLIGNICVSNDSFFKKEDDIRAAFQRKFKLKYEMNLEIPANAHTIAVGSFNYHNVNFSKAYNIRNERNQFVHTACVAFGLERFAYACIEQLGVDKIKHTDF